MSDSAELRQGLTNLKELPSLWGSSAHHLMWAPRERLSCAETVFCLDLRGLPLPGIYANYGSFLEAGSSITSPYSPSPS